VRLSSNDLTYRAVEWWAELDFGVLPNLVAGGAQPLEDLLAPAAASCANVVPVEKTRATQQLPMFSSFIST
jgi:hypothetical protein